MKKDPESKARPCVNCATQYNNRAANGELEEGKILIRGCCGTWQYRGGKFVRPLLRYSHLI